jgi:hypothetical protein
MKNILKDRSARYLVAASTLEYSRPHHRIERHPKSFLRRSLISSSCQFGHTTSSKIAGGKRIPGNLTELERIAGPIPRVVREGPSKSSRYTKAREELGQQTKAAVFHMSLKDITFAVGTADANDAKVAYRVLQIEVDRTTFARIGLRWVSPFVEVQFPARMTQISLHDKHTWLDTR